MTPPTQIPSDQSMLKRSLSIKALGIGGAGCNAVNHLASEALPGLSFAVMNTDGAALACSAVETRQALGAQKRRPAGGGATVQKSRGRGPGNRHAAFRLRGSAAATPGHHWLA